jgi:hypothetical protein
VVDGVEHSNISSSSGISSIQRLSFRLGDWHCSQITFSWDSRKIEGQSWPKYLFRNAGKSPEDGNDDLQVSVPNFYINIVVTKIMILEFHTERFVPESFVPENSFSFSFLNFLTAFHIQNGRRTPAAARHSGLYLGWDVPQLYRPFFTMLYYL